MKIAFVTVDLFKGREFLMPWRTVMEVVRGMRLCGIDADVVTIPVMSCASTCEESLLGKSQETILGLRIKKAPRNFAAFCQYVEKEGYDVVIYPTPWREALKKDFKAFADLKCKKIAYFPGGVYSWYNNFSLWQWGGLNVAKPYMIDTLTPYKRFTKLMHECGFDAVVGLSPYTAETVKKAGFANTLSILPGKDDFDKLDEIPNIFARFGLQEGEKYLLFTGAPAATRGAQVLVKACEKLSRICERTNAPKVIFLMRKDVGSDFTLFLQAYNKISNKNNVILITEKVNRNELKTLMAHARGVLLPFLVIPSEIPITYFEVLSLGVPIITFNNNGTTEYMKEALLVSKSGSVKGLINNMLKLWNDDMLHDDLSRKALAVMAKHPTWEEVTKQWINLVHNNINIKVDK